MVLPGVRDSAAGRANESYTYVIERFQADDGKATTLYLIAGPRRHAQTKGLRPG